MPSRRAFIAALAVVFAPATHVTAAALSQRREEALATVTLVIDGMT
jgi:hypothetical protein